MVMRKTVSLVGSLLILGLGYVFGQEQSKKTVRNEIRTRSRLKYRLRQKRR